MAGERVTRRQLVWVEWMLRGCSATEAARRAGYKCPRISGQENLHRPHLQALLKERLEELQMGTDEVLTRLAEQARADIGLLFKRDEKGAIVIDWDKIVPPEEEPEIGAAPDLEKRTLGHLIKSIAFTRHGPKVELYDGQRALELIGKHHGLFKDVEAHEGEVIVRVVYEDHYVDPAEAAPSAGADQSGSTAVQRRDLGAPGGQDGAGDGSAS